MKILYVDNYRGFKSAFLPLEEVNFFVGENSTGKTSILKLIGIISSPEFWNYQTFDSKEIELGAFEEIATDGSGKDYFEIGILGEDVSTNPSIKFKFTEVNHLPQVKEICFSNNNINVQASIEGTRLKYRYNEISLNKSVSDLEYFKQWIFDTSLKDQPFVQKEIEYIGINSILFQLQSFITTEISNYEHIFSTDFVNNLVWTVPVRSSPKRNYKPYLSSFDSDAKHSPYKLKNIWNEENPNIKKILKKFGVDSGLYDDIKIILLGDDSKKTASFEIQFILNGKALNIVNVGYGVSQILPVLIEVVEKSYSASFAIQQPEIHLHPKAQAAIGDFIFKSNDIDKHTFIIETHSDYTIDRYRLRVNRNFKETKIENSNSQVVFFNRNENGNNLHIIAINFDGSYSEDQPAEFRDFFLDEQLDLITI